jgi:hypothetical protein
MTTELHKEEGDGRASDASPSTLEQPPAPAVSAPPRCAWVDDGVACDGPLPYPGAKGHGHLCDKHLAAELARAEARRLQWAIDAGRR